MYVTLSSCEPANLSIQFRTCFRFIARLFIISPPPLVPSPLHTHSPVRERCERRASFAPQFYDLGRCVSECSSTSPTHPPQLRLPRVGKCNRFQHALILKTSVFSQKNAHHNLVKLCLLFQYQCCAVNLTANQQEAPRQTCQDGVECR